jgi:dihydrofolate synthase/folylpolyglutamate synthase
LDPTRALLAELGHPEGEYAAVHIGGTNGKGSVAALAYEALRAAGFSVGLYTSPHLVDVRERMVVDGRPITFQAFAGWTERLRGTIERVGASFFEATTAIALADFGARRVDMAVIEVGLGGRLDSTNVIRPLASAVTTIALEHTDYLGDTLEAIAREKAGIAKADTPFVIGEPGAAAAKVLRDVAEAVGARPIVAVEPGVEYEGPLGLEGPHQPRNAAVAAALLAALPDRWRPPQAALTAGFARARVPGRFDRRGRWIFDVAHNPAGIAVLLKALAQNQPPRPVHALVGILRDKAWPEMLAALAEGVDRMWLTAPPSAPAERSWDLKAVEAVMAVEAVKVAGGAGRQVPPLPPLPPLPPIVQPDFDLALQDVQRGAGTVLVTGSFHTVGDALARLPGFTPLG